MHRDRKTRNTWGYDRERWIRFNCMHGHDGGNGRSQYMYSRICVIVVAPMSKLGYTVVSSWNMVILRCS